MQRLVTKWVLCTCIIVAILFVMDWSTHSHRSAPEYIGCILTAIFGGWAMSFGHELYLRNMKLKN